MLLSSRALALCQVLLLICATESTAMDENRNPNSELSSTQQKKRKRGSNNETTGQKKRSRTTACERCYVRKQKCEKRAPFNDCANCIKAGQKCVARTSTGYHKKKLAHNTPAPAVIIGSPNSNNVSNDSEQTEQIDSSTTEVSGTECSKADPSFSDSETKENISSTSVDTTEAREPHNNALDTDNDEPLDSFIDVGFGADYHHFSGLPYLEVPLPSYSYKMRFDTSYWNSFKDAFMNSDDE